LGVYTLLVNAQTQKDWQSEMAILEGVVPDEWGQFKRVKIHYSEEELNWIKAWIAHAKSRVDSMEFLSGCGKCAWCEFAKTSGQSALPEWEDDTLV